MMGTMGFSLKERYRELGILLFEELHGRTPREDEIEEFLEVEFLTAIAVADTAHDTGWVLEDEPYENFARICWKREKLYREKKRTGND